MNNYSFTRFLIPAVIFIIGVYNLTSPDTDPEDKTFWWLLTGFALLIGGLRAFMLYKHKKKSDAMRDENL